MDSEEENIKKMLKGEPYTHEGMTEYDGLPPMSPHPIVTGERVDRTEYHKMVEDFVERISKKKK